MRFIESSNRHFLLFWKAYGKHLVSGNKSNPNPTNHSASDYLAPRAGRFLPFLLITLIFQLLTFPSCVSAQTEVEGEVSGVWDVDGSPYVMVGNATVPEDESLTIDPGVEVILGEDLTLLVNGWLSAVGTEEDTIRFHGPEGLVAGTMRLTSAQDTARFQYCRFDSLSNAIWMQDNTMLKVDHCFFWECRYSIASKVVWAEVTNCSFITLRQNGTVGLGRDQNQGYNDGVTAIFTDNWVQGRVEVKCQCVSATVERNSSEPLSVDDNVRTALIRFWESRNFTCRDNQNYGISSFNQNRDLISALVENNESGSFIGFSSPGNARLIVRNNRSDNITFRNANNAEATGNITKGYGCEGSTRLTATRNLGYFWLSGDDNQATLVNNTIIKNNPIREGGGQIYSVINCSGDNPQGNRITLHNNLIGSVYGNAWAVDPAIEVTGEGYNYFWRVNEVYGSREDLLPNDQVGDPSMRGGFPFDYRLRADSPCIDAGDLNSPEDPDGTRADIGCYYFDQENGEPPTLDQRRDYYIGWNEIFRYAARAVDEGERLTIEFDDLPEWLEVEDEGQRDFVRDSLFISGVVPEGQEDFLFNVRVQDDADREDTLSVRVMVYPYRVLTGVVRGVLDLEQSPFIIADTAWIPAGDSLVLPPGTELYFDNRNDSLTGRAKSMLMVEGVLKAVGTEDDSVYFHALDLERINSGLYLENSSAGDLNEFDFCRFNGVEFQAWLPESDISISNSLSSEGVSNYLVASNHEGEMSINNNYGNAGMRFVGNGVIENNGDIGLLVAPYDSVTINDNRLNSLRVYYYGNSQVNITNNFLIGGVKLNLAHNNLLCQAFVTDNSIKQNWNDEAIEIAAVEVDLTNNCVDSVGTAIRVYGSEQRASITNNTFTNIGLAIYSRWPANNLVVCNNLFYGLDTLLLSYAGYTTGITYNSIHDYGFISDDTTFKPELIQTNANGDSVDAYFNLYLDPKIASSDSLDFRLYEDSPLIDAGNPGEAFNDLDSTVNDIGLFGGPHGDVYEYLEPNAVIDFTEPPHQFQVGAVYPNPFNSNASISIELPRGGEVSFSLFDIQGRKVAGNKQTLASGAQRRTLSNFLMQDLGNLNSGVYVLTIDYEQTTINRRVVLVK